MAKRIVKWTETAIKQRRAVLKYWTLRNKSTLYAEKIIKISEIHTKSISLNPFAFCLCDFPETHVAAMGHFSIFYKFNDYVVYITAFWDNRQNPEKLEKLLRD